MNMRTSALPAARLCRAEVLMFIPGSASRLSRLWSLTCQMFLEQLQLYFPCSPGLEKLSGCCKAAAHIIKKGLMLQLFHLEMALPRDKLSLVFLGGPLAR